MAKPKNKEKIKKFLIIIFALFALISLVLPLLFR